MHTPQRSPPFIIRNARLRDFRVKAVRLEFILAPGTTKETATVFHSQNVDEENTLDSRLCKNHFNTC